MKRILTFALALILCVLPLCGCGGGERDENTLLVGASITPHADILKQAVPLMAEKGYTLEIREFEDYVIPNTALESGELDANYFQHKPYMDNFNEENGTHLVAAAFIHYEPFGLYPGKVSKLDDLASGATIIVPNDGTNEARALMLLEAQGLIKLKENAGFTATVLDIAENPKNLTIKEVDAAQLARSLQDVDMAVINGNYALQANLNPLTDAIAIEDQTGAGGTYANIICVKEGNENDPRIQALIEVLKSETIRNYITETYQGSVVPMD
ncbi:MAG: MetQ/NlpA family ABC transporter substrate-binding protein [Clostridia bacterium]|nr:MetQ/NlpA family ABC transporter substrate-binding protein [Clostridia bacterium]